MKFQIPWLDEQLPHILSVRDRAGWRPTTLDAGSFSSRCMCVLSELRELEQAVRQRDESQIARECADVVLYLIIILYDLRAAILQEVTEALVTEGVDLDATSPLAITHPTRAHVILTWEQWRRDVSPGVIYEGIRLALLEALYMAASLGVDLETAVREKTEINSKRGRHHGGKHPDT